MDLVLVNKYLLKGFNVIPLKPKSKEPLIKWQDYQSRRITLDEIKKYFISGNANIGIITGKISNLIVVDFDTQEAFQKFIDDYHFEPHKYPSVRTPRGRHFYFRYREGIRTKKLEGVDIKSDGGYVVAPDSISSAGIRYVWELSIFNFGELPELPECFLEFEDKPAFKEYHYDEILQGLTEGRRNEGLTSYAGHLFKRGLNYNEVKDILLALNLKNKPPLDEKEVLQIVNSISRKELANKINIINKTENIAEFTLYIYNYKYSFLIDKVKQKPVVGHQDLAAWINERFKDEIFYASHSKTWYKYINNHWTETTEENIKEKVAELITEIQDFIFTINNDNELKAKLILALKPCRNSNFVGGALDYSKGEEKGLGKNINQIDNYPYLLNLENGIYDLKENKLIEHNPRFYITKRVNASYNPNTISQRWINFLNDIFQGDNNLIDYVQRALGYSLLGYAQENKLFVCYGKGRNGKSTFLNTISYILNDYAKNLQSDSLLEKEAGTIREDLARLHNCRFITISELPENKKIDITLLKQLTGQDKISARFLYAKTFEFVNQGKIWIVTNNKPSIWEINEAVKRRLKFIPFVYTIPEDKIIVNYEQLLLEEKEGILNWLIEGWEKYQQRGLKENEEPDAVKAMSKEFFEEIDWLTTFIKENFIIYQQEENQEFLRRDIPRSSIKKVYEIYLEWVKKIGEKPVSKRKLASMIDNRAEDYNIIRYRTDTGERGWKGLKIKETKDEDLPF